MEIKPSENDPNAFVAECKTPADVKCLKTLEYFTHDGVPYKVLNVKDGVDKGDYISFLVIAEKDE